jgi:vacuolar protein sorting-associated protein 54
MLRDVEFFQSRLGKIDGFEDAGDYLLSAIKSKKIIAPEPAPAPTPAPAPAPTAAAPTPTPSPPPASEEKEAMKIPAEEPLSAELQAQVGATVHAQKNGDSSDASKA